MVFSCRSLRIGDWRWIPLNESDAAIEVRIAGKLEQSAVIEAEKVAIERRIGDGFLPGRGAFRGAEGGLVVLQLAVGGCGQKLAVTFGVAGERQGYLVLGV